MTDLVWLNMFRIMSTRLGRKKPFLPALIYLPIDKDLINEFSDKFRLIAEKHGIDNDLVLSLPSITGKDAFLNMISSMIIMILRRYKE
jgi:hypothetical protein